MMNGEGVFIGQICHIEAAEEGGERFNPNQTNEERRHLSNLMLMCYEHHRVTNDVVKYTVPILKGMKQVHEAKFTDIAAAMGKAIEDQAAKTVIKPAQSLSSISTTLNWGLDAEQLKIVIEDAVWAATQIRSLPIATRQLLTVIVSRMERITLQRGNLKYRYNTNVLHHEISQACHLSDAELVSQVQILEKYGIASGHEEDDDVPAHIRMLNCPNEWDIWGDLREFSTLKRIPVEAFTEDLRFDLLD